MLLYLILILTVIVLTIMLLVGDGEKNKVEKYSFISPKNPMIKMNTVKYNGKKLQNLWTKEEEGEILHTALENFTLYRLSYSKEPLITIVTRTMNFDLPFQRCCESVENMKPNFEHIILKDEVGKGMLYAEAALAAFSNEYRGEYICHLDDDDFIHNSNFTLDMEHVIREKKPKMIVFKIWHEPRKQYLPDSKHPREGSICTNCVLFHKTLYLNPENHLGLLREHAGDYEFIHNALIEAGEHVVWVEKDYMTVQSKEQFQIRGRFRCTPVLQGGLGNQLFQWAAAYAYAKNHGKDLVMDDNVQFTSPGRRYHKSIFRNENGKQIMMRKPTHGVLVEKDFTFNELEYLPGNVNLRGYFQSTKYFEDFSEEVKTIIRSRLPSIEVQDYLPDVKNLVLNTEYWVCVHVRRTDYLQSPLHTVLPLSYYEEAMKHFPNHMFCVFSDDLSSAKELFQHRKDVIFIDGKIALNDMALMSTFEKFILANSTFSWWASYLASSKEIYVPYMWFNTKKDISDLLREEFILVNF